MGMDNFIWFHGIVEDTDDPLMIGRCRVRVIGLHTDNRSILPTDKLPWASPMMPITSASIGGIGISPTGIMLGSWVVGFFRDGESAQDPIMMGTIPGIPSGPDEDELDYGDPNLDGYPYKEETSQYNSVINESDVNRLARGATTKKVFTTKIELIEYFKNIHDGLGFDSPLLSIFNDLTMNDLFIDDLMKLLHDNKDINDLILSNALGRHDESSVSIVTLMTSSDNMSTEDLRELLSNDVLSDILTTVLAGKLKDAELLLDLFMSFEKWDWVIEEETTVSETEVSVDTIVTNKKSSVINNSLFSEPPTKYAPTYPDNKVLSTESGHHQEFDDTRGAERIHTYHKSGSFEEYHPNGDRVTKIVGNDYEIVYGNKNLHVSGNLNIYVNGSVKIKVNGSWDAKVGGSHTTNSGGNMKKTAPKINLN